MDRESISFDLAQKLKSLRQEHNLSHQKLCEALQERYNISISKQSLINYEAGEYSSKAGACLAMNLEYLCCLADFYGVSFDYLLTPGNTVRNPDTSVQAIHRCTFFSEAAVKVLSDGFVEKDGYRESLDSVLSSVGLENLLHSLVNVKEAIKIAGGSIKSARVANLDAGNTSTALRFARDHLLFSVWQASKAATDICYELFEVKQTEEELLYAIEEARNGEHQED